MLLLTAADVDPDMPNVIESLEPNGSPKPRNTLLNIFFVVLKKHYFLIKFSILIDELNSYIGNVWIPVEFTDCIV